MGTISSDILSSDDTAYYSSYYSRAAKLNMQMNYVMLFTASSITVQLRLYYVRIHGG